MPLNAQTGFNMIIIEQFKVHNIITNYVTSFGKGIFWSILDWSEYELNRQQAYFAEIWSFLFAHSRVMWSEAAAEHSPC